MNAKIIKTKDVELKTIYPFTIMQTDNLERNEKGTGDTENVKRSATHRAKQQVKYYAMANLWDYMITITLDPKKVDRHDYGACMKYTRLQLKMFKHRYCKDLEYVIVPDFHQDKAIHFHGLIKSKDIKKVLEDSNLKDNKGNRIFNITKGITGFNTVVPIEYKDVESIFKIANYITKYLTKNMPVSNIIGKQRYMVSNNLKVPKVIFEMILDKEKELTDSAKNPLTLDIKEFTKTINDNEFTFTNILKMSSPF